MVICAATNLLLMKLILATVVILRSFRSSLYLQNALNPAVLQLVGHRDLCTFCSSCLNAFVRFLFSLMPYCFFNLPALFVDCFLPYLTPKHPISGSITTITVMFLSYFIESFISKSNLYKLYLTFYYNT